VATVVVVTATSNASSNLLVDHAMSSIVTDYLAAAQHMYSQLSTTTCYVVYYLGTQVGGEVHRLKKQVMKGCTS